MLGGKRKSVPIVMIVGCCYMTTGQYFTILGANFPVFRVLLIVGVARVLMRGEKISGGMNAIDRAIILMCCWVVFASLFHEWEAGSGPINLTGLWRSLGHPVVRDAAGDTWVLGTSAGARGQTLETLDAPDFALPDLDGRTHTLSQLRGKKVFLATWASW